MIRLVLENLALLLTPTVIYLAYVMLVRRRTESVWTILNEAPLVTLFVVGAILTVATLAWFGSKQDSPPNLGYQPPVLKDGRIEPGRNQ